MQPELPAILAIGFIGSLHCLGMCGPLVLAYSLQAGKHDPGSGVSPWRRRLLHQAPFHLGRLLTYGSLGAAAGGLLGVAQLSRLFSGTRTGASLFGGVLLILAGAALLRVIPLPRPLAKLFQAQGTLTARFIPGLARSPGPFSGIALGIAAGFIPCCLSWAALITAATTEDPVRGFLVMAAFWAGTLPALLSAGLFSSFFSVKVRVLGEKAAALLVIASGVLLITRGAGILV